MSVVILILGRAVTGKMQQGELGDQCELPKFLNRFESGSGAVYPAYCCYFHQPGLINLLPIPALDGGISLFSFSRPFVGDRCQSRSGGFDKRWRRYFTRIDDFSGGI